MKDLEPEATWIHCRVEDEFRGAGGPAMPMAMTETFRAWATGDAE